MVENRVQVEYGQVRALYPALREIAQLHDDSDVVEVDGVSTPVQISPEDFKIFCEFGNIFPSVMDGSKFRKDIHSCPPLDRTWGSALLDSGACRLWAGASSLYLANPLFLRELYARMVRADYQDGKLDHEISPEWWHLPEDVSGKHLHQLFQKYFGRQPPEEMSRKELFEIVSSIVNKDDIPKFPSNVFYAGPAWDPMQTAILYIKYYKPQVEQLVKKVGDDFHRSGLFYAGQLSGMKMSKSLRYLGTGKRGALAKVELRYLFWMLKHLRGRGKDKLAQTVCGRLGTEEKLAAEEKGVCFYPEGVDKGGEKLAGRFAEIERLREQEREKDAQAACKRLDNKERQVAEKKGVCSYPGDFRVYTTEIIPPRGYRSFGEVYPVKPMIFLYVNSKAGQTFLFQPWDRARIGWSPRGNKFYGHLRDIKEYFEGRPMEFEPKGGGRGVASMPWNLADSRLPYLLDKYHRYRHYYYQPTAAYASTRESHGRRWRDFSNIDYFWIKMLHETWHYHKLFEDPLPISGIAKDWSLEYLELAAGERLFQVQQSSPAERSGSAAEEGTLEVFRRYQRDAVEFEADEVAYKTLFGPEEMTVNTFGSTSDMLLKPLFREYLMRGDQLRKVEPEDGYSDSSK